MLILNWCECVLFLLDRGEAVSRKHISESLELRLYFLFPEHEVFFPVGDIKAALSPALLRWRHKARPHTSLSLLTFSLLRDAVFTSLPQRLSFFSSSMLFLWEQHPPLCQHLISFSLLCSCETVTSTPSFTNNFSPLCRPLFHTLQPLWLQWHPSESSVTHHSNILEDELCDQSNYCNGYAQISMS